MLQFHCFDGDKGWNCIPLKRLDDVEAQTYGYTTIATDLSPQELAAKLIDVDIYGEFQCKAVCRCKLQRGQCYQVVTGSTSIVCCPNLVFSEEGVDPKGYKYLEFENKQHPVRVYLGERTTLFVPQPLN